MSKTKTVKTIFTAMLAFLFMLGGTATANAHAGHDHITFVDLYIQESSIIIDVKMEPDVVQETFNAVASENTPQATWNLIAEYVLERSKAYSGETELQLSIVETRYDDEEVILKPVVRLEATHTELLSDEVSFAFNFFIEEDFDHTIYVFILEDVKYGLSDEEELFSTTDLYYGANGFIFDREERLVDYFHEDNLGAVTDETALSESETLAEESTQEEVFTDEEPTVTGTVGEGTVNATETTMKTKSPMNNLMIIVGLMLFIAVIATSLQGYNKTNEK